MLLYNYYFNQLMFDYNNDELKILAWLTLYSHVKPITLREA